ncbi:cation:proton antiporter [endosymbiont of Ridgeia piscesae]|jgi:NhaP-type Na+/H+ or K+/H+ antiporter|uniref:Cation/H+ exchanger domain-containing protein n=1 Tax=endosymbiont of Ridgeia piscesae TaxID=54398 RepID=A0A0T5YZK0_9GAMM|nr:hypothetical protein [endosymbiont of Ridgeia piscesae]KRT55750.1 hypothetical protein Ga0074115_12357 [endosymbiont of Ridgeia piscesae]KRT59721.1 hypothetical protein Ga0076813_15963 [endosymbiont of Ridgeia piscesae]
MDDTAEFLTTIGGILLFGLLTDFLGRYTFLPRVTLLLLFGLLIGHEGLDLISSVVSERFEIITNMALLMVGFLLGGKLTGESLRSCGSQLFWISVSAVAGTWLAVLPPPPRLQPPWMLLSRRVPRGASPICYWRSSPSMTSGR